MFDVFDVDKSGTLEFDEFYLLVCILISIKDRDEKQFLHYHWRTCFELLDVDGSKSITVPEFLSFGFIFNFNKKLVTQIFKEFDVDDSMALDHDEFRMFTLYAIDKQMEYDEKLERRKREGRFKNKSDQAHQKVAPLSADSLREHRKYPTYPEGRKDTCGSTLWHLKTGALGRPAVSGKGDTRSEGRRA